jgi:hypothetical protein
MSKAKSEGWHGFTLKDLLSLSVSLGAFIISGTAAYYTFFYQRISANALIDDPYPQYEFVQSSMTDIAYRPTITIMNDGNRPVALLGMTVTTRQWQELPSEANVCESERGNAIARFSTSPSQNTFAPTVIPPASVVVLRPSFTAAMRQSATAARPGERIPQNVSPDKLVSSCLRVELAAPDRGSIQVELPLSRQSLSFGGGEERLEAYSEGSLINLVN